MYILKHRNLDVALLEIGSDGSIIKINEVYIPEHLPLSCVREDGIVNEKRIKTWWDERGIPATREGYQAVMKLLRLKYARD